MLRKFGIIAVVSLLAVAFAAVPALAVTDFSNAPTGAHYAQGSGEPVCTLAGLTVTCTGTEIQGVGHTNATVVTSVTSTFTGVCHNPGRNSKVVEPFTDSETNTTSATIPSTRNGALRVPQQTATG